MDNNQLDQNSGVPQQNMNGNNSQPVYQQQPVQNGYYQQPSQNGYYQQPQNGYYQQQYQQPTYQNGYNSVPLTNEQKRPMSGSTLPLAIVGLVFSLLIPLVTYICSIISLTTATKKKAYERTTPACC